MRRANWYHQALVPRRVQTFLWVHVLGLVTLSPCTNLYGRMEVRQLHILGIDEIESNDSLYIQTNDLLRLRTLARAARCGGPTSDANKYNRACSVAPSYDINTAPSPVTTRPNRPHPNRTPPLFHLPAAKHLGGPGRAIKTSTSTSQRTMASLTRRAMGVASRAGCVVPRAARLGPGAHQALPGWAYQKGVTRALGPASFHNTAHRSLLPPLPRK